MLNLRALRRPRKFFDWALLAVGAAVAWSSAYTLFMGCASATWPKIDGVVTYSRAHNSFRQRQIDVRYEFTAGGHQYSGDRWRYLFIINRSPTRSTWIIDAVQASYPVGQRVKISVRPGDPSESVLEAGASLADLTWVFAGLALMLAGLLPGWKERRRSEAYSSPRPSGATVLSLAGVAVMLVGAYWLYHGTASRFWPTATGKVLYSTIYAKGSQINYQGEVRYQYEVSGTRYLGDRSQYGSLETARAWVKANPVGHTIAVHYNPIDAWDSEPSPGVAWRDFILPLIGLAMFAAARWWRKVAKIRERPETP